MKTRRNKMMFGTLLGCVCWGVVACDVQPVGAGRGTSCTEQDDGIPGTLPTVSGMMLAPYAPPTIDVVNLGFDWATVTKTIIEK